MAELAAIGAAASIVQLVQFGSHVVSRLLDYQSEIGSLPRVFRHVQKELRCSLKVFKPISLLPKQETETKVESKRNVSAVIRECEQLVQELDAIVTKTLPKNGGSWLSRKAKAIESLRYDGKIERSMLQLRKYVTTLTYDRVADLSGTPLSFAIFIVPFRRDRHFVDRAILEKVENKGQQPASRVALVGLGGVGKSQLAVEYAYRMQDKIMNISIIWVHAGTKARFEEGYRSIANGLQIPRRDQSGVDILSLVHDWLSNVFNGKWLMIIDNADDESVFLDKSVSERTVLDCIPQSQHGSILITSRNRDAAFRLTGVYADILDVEPMDEAQSLTLLRNKLETYYGQNDEEKNDAILLVASLDYMPLAITQAAVYIVKRRSRVTVSSYLQKLREGGQEMAKLLETDLSDNRRDGTASNSIMFTWQISFEYIRDNSPTAARLLSITSLFNRQGIPISLLEAYYQDNDDTDADFEVDLDTLLNFSLVSVEVDGCHLQMHRLVQFLITRWFDLHGELDCWKQTYVTVLRDNHPRAKVAKREEYQRILPHVEAAITYQPKNEDALDSWATLLELSASYGSCISHHKKAEELARYALATRETTLGNMDPQTLDTSHRLVVILSNSRKFEDAELLARKVLQARQEILGAEHKDTLKSRITLAVILTGLGGWEEAKMIFCEALEVLRKIGEPVHSSISWIMSKFLHAIAHQGRYGEAELIQREVLRKFDTAAGTTEVKEHLMMSTMVNLGRTLQEQKKFEEAKTWFIQALKYCKEQYGAKHINYLAIVFDYADNLGSMGEYKEAEPLFREALADMESIFTEDNLDILMCRQMLGTALRMQHKNQEAEDIFRRTLAGNVRLLGEEHRYTLASMHALAMVLSELGSYEEAEGLYRRTLAGRLRLLGEEDRRTIDAIYWLATFLENSARYKEADELFRRALTGYLKIYGEESSDTLFSMYNLANTQWMLGRSGEAIALMTQCFQVQKKVLGYDHEYTRLSLAYLKGMRDEEFKDADMDEVTEQLETLTTESEVTGEAGVSN